MLSFLKLKKKSKKDKGQDDEKENASSPTKVKKLDKSRKSSNDERERQTGSPQSPPSRTPEAKRPSQPTNGGANLADRIKRNSLRDHDANQHLTVETNQRASSQQPSPLSSKSAATTINIQHPRHPVLSASDAANSTSFVRGNFLSSTISGSELHRFLNSGYMNGDTYLSRGVEPKTPKSPHFHRPPNFSYSRNAPNYVTHRHASANRGGMRALINASSASSDTRRINRATLNGANRMRSISPMQQQSTTVSKQNPDGTVTETTTTVNTSQVTTTVPVSVRDLDTEEPIRLSKFSGGYEPDPTSPRKIERLDWPAPPYPAAVPELRARSRSSSNRRAPSTVTSIRGEELDEEDEDEEEELQRIDVTNPNQPPTVTNRQSTGAASVSSSMARAKASRPNSKLHYHNKLFENDYDDYLLRYKSDKEFRKVLNKSTSGSGVGGGTRGTRYQSGESSACEDLNPEHVDQIDSDEEVPGNSLSPKLQKEIEEISKIEPESSMAHAILSDLKNHQRIVSQKPKLDPWKASRSPSAKVEPPIRTRFKSPVNASPSRIFNYPRSGNYTTSGCSSVNNNLLSPLPDGQAGASTTASTSCFDESCIMSPTGHSAAANPTAIQQSSQSNLQHPMSPTRSSYAQPHHYHIPQSQQFASASSISNASYLQKNNYINSSNRIITTSAAHKAGLNNIVYNMAVPKPGYGLTSPNKSITLPNSSRYIGLTSHRSVDFDTAGFSSASYLGNSSEHQLSPGKRQENIYRNYYLGQNLATRSTPNLIGVPKIYSYEALKINRKKKLPPDVDRERLERHLSADEFQAIFGMNLQQFYELSEWKRVQLKKRAKLF